MLYINKTKARRSVKKIIPHMGNGDFPLRRDKIKDNDLPNSLL